jgi:hypothetical protein
MPLTGAGPDKTGPSDLLNWIVRFSCFEQELLAPYLIRVPTHFGDSAGESTTSSMKKGGPAPMDLTSTRTTSSSLPLTP